MKSVETGVHLKGSQEREKGTGKYEDRLKLTLDTAKLENLIDDFAALNLPKEVEGDNYADRTRVFQATRRFLAEFSTELGIAHNRITTSLLKADGSFAMEVHTGAFLPTPKYVLENARRILTLEKKSPGSVLYLYEQRGIRNFARYSVAFWQRQYKERTSELPCMLVIVPSALGKSTPRPAYILSSRHV